MSLRDGDCLSVLSIKAILTNYDSLPDTSQAAVCNWTAALSTFHHTRYHLVHTHTHNTIVSIDTQISSAYFNASVTSSRPFFILPINIFVTDVDFETPSLLHS